MSRLYDIANSAISGLTPFHVLTGAGLGLSSFLFLSQLGGAQFGVAPMVCKAAARQQLSIPIELAVRQWHWFFVRASPPVVGGVAGGALSYLTASYLVPDRHAKADSLRFWLRFAALVAFIPLPYTIQALGPTNSALIKLAKQAAASPSATFSVTEAGHASKLLDTWVRRHAIRIGLYALSVVVGVVPLLAA